MGRLKREVECRVLVAGAVRRCRLFRDHYTVAANGPAPMNLRATVPRILQNFAGLAVTGSLAHQSSTSAHVA